MAFPGEFNGVASRPIREPWLIQRAKVNALFGPDMKASEYMKLDYMGAAEFEFGALPEWLRLMNKKMRELSIYGVEHEEMKLYFMCEGGDVEQYTKILRGLIDGTVRTKMGVRLNDRDITYEGKKKHKLRIYSDPSAPFTYDVWWDITNTLIFARDEHVLMNVKKMVANSVKFMDKQKGG